MSKDERPLLRLTNVTRPATRILVPGGRQGSPDIAQGRKRSTRQVRRRYLLPSVVPRFRTLRVPPLDCPVQPRDEREE
jgi:hypothetical protein